MALEPETLIEFPCDFPIKVLGRTQAGFAQAVLAIVREHAQASRRDHGDERRANAGNTCVTAVLRATSREQLDDLYRELWDHPMVVMVL